MWCVELALAQVDESKTLQFSTAKVFIALEGSYDECMCFIERNLETSRGSTPTFYRIVEVRKND